MRFLAVLLLLAPSLAQAKVDVLRQDQQTTYRFAVEDVQFDPVTVAGRSFDAARLVGVQGYAGVTYKIGEPEIPVIRFYVHGDPAPRVQVGTATFGALTHGVPLKPSQPARVKLPGQAETLAMSQPAYARQTYAREPDYTVTPAGSIDGVPQSLVTLYPFHYVPGAGRWTLTKSFTVTAKDAPAAAAPAREIFAFVVGPSFKASPSLAKYEQLKAQLGYEVQQIDVTPQDTPDTIRAALKKLYARTDAKLRYALIIGKDTEVPAHTSTHIAGITDHYYRAIDTDDYESDIDGPDIGVGRVSVTAEDQLAAVLDKFTRYTLGVFGAETWLGDLSFLATDDQYQVAEGSHNYVIDTYTASKGYLGDFPAANTQGGDKLYAITNHATEQDVLKALGEGRAIVDYSGHGATDEWAGPEVTEADVQSLKDPNALPFVVGNACVTGDFRVDTSFAETWERSPTGSITYWGSMDSTFWDEDDILERAMFDGIFQGGKATFDQITTNAQSQLWAHFGGQGYSAYYWETYTTFGDPSLPLRTTKNRALKIDGPTSLPVGVQSATFAASDASGPAAGVRIAIMSQAGDFRLAGVTGADGKITFDVSAATREAVQLSVAATAQNAPLVTSDVSIVPTDVPYLSLDRITPNGRAGTAVYLGETVGLGMQVTNLGKQPTAGATLSIAQVQGPATVISGSTRIPALGAATPYALAADALRVAVAADAPVGAAVTLTLKWVTDEGQSAEVPVVLLVQRAALAVTAIDYGTPGADGGIKPGAAGPVFLTVQNTGNEPIASGTLNGTRGTCVAAVSGTATIQNLAPGASVRLAQPLEVTIDAQCRDGDAVTLTAVGSYASVAEPVPLSAPVQLIAGILSEVQQDEPSLSVAIPDNGPAITQAIHIAKSGKITAVGVHVKITHPYASDLQIQLIAPDGTAVMLRDRTGDPGVDVDDTYGLGGTPLPALDALKGKDAAGDWKLSVQDMAEGDVGTLTEVDLTVKGYFE